MITVEGVHQSGNRDTIACAMLFYSTGINRYTMHYVNGVKMMYGSGEIKRVIVGEYPRTFIRTFPHLSNLIIQGMGENYVDCRDSSNNVDVLWALRLRRHGHAG
jgi:hypothetical protein